jgi:hypothetical protein
MSLINAALPLFRFNFRSLCYSSGGCRLETSFPNARKKKQSALEA